MTEPMTQAHLDDDRCADLMLGLLPDAERELSLAHARRCPSCEERLRAHARAKAQHDARSQRRSTSAGTVLSLPPRARGRWIVFGAAAALAVVLGLPRLLPPHEPAPMHWLPAPGSGLTLRDGGSDPHLTTGLEAYGRRDLATARKELEVAQVSGGNETARRLYLSNTLLALDETESALTLLQSIDLLTLPAPWREEALWSLQLAYRRTGQERRADSLRRELASPLPGTP